MDGFLRHAIMARFGNTIRHLYYFRFWFAIGILLVGLVLYLSLMRSPPDPFKISHADKFEHLLAYGSLMLWFSQLYRRRVHIWIGVALVFMGIGVEFAQAAGGYRMFEYSDMLANSTGVVLGWLLAGTAVAGCLAGVEQKLRSS